MKSNYLVWLLAAGVLLLGIWYWTNAQEAAAPATTPAESEVMLEDGETGEAMEEDAELTTEEGEDAMMEDESTGGAEDDAMEAEVETTIEY